MPDDVDMASAVTVAYVHQHGCAMSWHHSFVDTLMYDIANEGRLFRGGKIAINSGTDGLVESRNMAIRIFLTERQAEWLWWVDTDMGWEAPALDQLFEAADVKERPMVGALAFTQRQIKPDGRGGWVTAPAPTIYDWTKLPNGQVGFAVRWEVPDNTLVRCQGTGSACVLVHRSVFERVSAAVNPATGEPFGEVWYDRIRNTSTGQLMSEDLSFCLRLGAQNIPLHVHTGVEATHKKEEWLSLSGYRRWQAVEKALTAKAEVAAAP